MSNCEDSIYDLEKTFEKSIDEVRLALNLLYTQMGFLESKMDELLKLHKLEPQECTSKHPMLKETYEKHNFAKQLVLGDDNG
jgi:hypothetical protein